MLYNLQIFGLTFMFFVTMSMSLQVTPNCLDCRYYLQERYPYQNNVYGKCALFKRLPDHLMFDGKAPVPANTPFQYASVARNREWMCGETGRKYISKYNIGKRVLDM